jgi:hypothetical protein
MAGQRRGLARNENAEGTPCPCDQCRLRFCYSKKQIKRHLILHPPVARLSNDRDHEENDSLDGAESVNDDGETDPPSETDEEEEHEDDTYLHDHAERMLRKIRENFFSPIEYASSDSVSSKSRPSRWNHCLTISKLRPSLWNTLGFPREEESKHRPSLWNTFRAITVSQILTSHLISSGLLG